MMKIIFIVLVFLSFIPATAFATPVVSINTEGCEYVTGTFEGKISFYNDKNCLTDIKADGNILVED